MLWLIDSRMNIGLSTYSYPWAVGVPGYEPEQPLTALALLDRAARLGVQAVQFGDNLPLHTLSATAWQTLRTRAGQLNLQIEVGTRRLTVDHLDRYLRLAAEAGSPFLRVVIDDADYKPNEHEVVAVIRAVLPLLAETQVVLALENHDRFSARALERIIQQTDAERVGICLDTTNSFGAAEDVHTVVSVLGPYTVNLHAKDFVCQRVSHKMGFSIVGVCPGTGQLDLPAVLGELARFGRCQTVTLEQWPPFRNTLDETIAIEAEWAENGVEWIRQNLRDIDFNQKL